MDESLSAPEAAILPTEALVRLSGKITISWGADMDAALGRKLVAEGVGAFALSFIGVGAIIYGQNLGGGAITTVALANIRRSSTA